MMLAFSSMFGGEDTPRAVFEKAEGIGSDALSDEDVTYVEEVVSGVDEHAAEIDALVSEYAVDWSIGRIARVDLSILRVAIYEMLYREDVPTGAAINEAVELAKRYGGERSYSFINGILGSVAKRIAAT